MELPAPMSCCCNPYCGHYSACLASYAYLSLEFCHAGTLGQASRGSSISAYVFHQSRARHTEWGHSTDSTVLQ